MWSSWPLGGNWGEKQRFRLLYLMVRVKNLAFMLHTDEKTEITSMQHKSWVDPTQVKYLFKLLHTHLNYCFVIRKFLYHYLLLSLCIYIKRKRKRSDSVLWQKPIHQQKCQKAKVTTQTTPQKSSITQRLRTDLGRSVGVTTCIISDEWHA